jgi:hypothetical protein
MRFEIGATVVVRNPKSISWMSAVGLDCVKTQRRANCREKYSFGSLLQEREEHIEPRRRGI